MPRKRFRVGWLSVTIGAICMLACISTAVLWGRSFWISDTFGFYPLTSAGTERGEIVFSTADPQSNFTTESGYHREQLPDPDEPWNPRRVARRTWNLLFAHGESFPGLHLVVIRFWAIFIVAAFPILFVAARSVRRWRSVSAGLCGVCGYDLRASPKRCPECGAPSV